LLYAAFVKAIASELDARTNDLVDEMDAHSYAVLGLIRAIEQYEPTSDTTRPDDDTDFKHFALTRIFRVMTDGWAHSAESVRDAGNDARTVLPWADAFDIVRGADETQIESLLQNVESSLDTKRGELTPTPVVAPAFADEAARIRRIGHLKDSDIAQVTGAAPSTVGHWVRGDRDPSGVRAERLAELSAIVERLARVIEPSRIPVWLRKPVPALDDEKPIELLQRGEWQRVARLISSLESPTFS
jgi:hypothetical protein